MATVKPGWKTTEFWFALAGKVFGLLAMFGVHPKVPDSVAEVIVGAGAVLATGSTVAYNAARATTKKGANAIVAPAVVNEVTTGNP